VKKVGRGRAKKEKESEYTFEMAQRLYFEEGRSIKEIANIMNVKESSIKTYISQERNVGINKPYKQIVKEEKERRERTGIRWGAGYIKVEPRPVEKFDLSEYYTIPFNGRKRERVVNDE
jgi:sigma-70, region 4